MEGPRCGSENRQVSVLGVNHLPEVGDLPAVLLSCEEERDALVAEAERVYRAGGDQGLIEVTEAFLHLL